MIAKGCVKLKGMRSTEIWWWF